MTSPRSSLLTPESPRPLLESGMSVGPYRIDRVLGRGGMGVVYLAEDTRLHRLVALKSLAPELSAGERQRERLKREARAAAALAHPGIATIYALEELDDQLYIASEYLEGETLQSRSRAGRVAAGTRGRDGARHRPRARRRARTRHRPSRPQTRERRPHHGRLAEDPRLRPRAVPGRRTRSRVAHAAHRYRSRRRHAVLHGAGAAVGPRHGLPRRPVRARRRAVRALHGPAPVRGPFAVVGDRADPRGRTASPRECPKKCPPTCGASPSAP